jgi:DNA-binding CsgD family transcriptional regulator
MLSDELNLDVLDQVLCAVREHVFVVDRHGVIVYANLPLAQAWLMDRAELVGRTFADIASPRESVARYDHMREIVFESGQQTREISSVAYRALGRRDMELVLSPIFEPEGFTVRLAFGVSVDVTRAVSETDMHPEAGNGQSRPVISDRRREVLTLVAQGFANKEIGRVLEISVRTVESHRRAIAGQLHLNTRGDYFRFAKDNGYI